MGARGKGVPLGRGPEVEEGHLTPGSHGYVIEHATSA